MTFVQNGGWGLAGATRLGVSRDMAGNQFQRYATGGKDSRGFSYVPITPPAPAPAPAAAPPPPAAAAAAPAPALAAPPPAPVTASGAGDSAAAQATTATKDRAEVSYRESLPATTHRQNPWKPGDHANNANLATQGMLDAARGAQESTTRSADRFDAIALNSSQWMADIDSRNLNRLSPSLALPKNPTDALRGFYEDISNDMRKTLGPFA